MHGRYFSTNTNKGTTKQKLSTFRAPTQLLVKLEKVHPYKKHSMHFASFVPENIWHLQLTATASERFNLTVTPLKRNYLAQPDVAVISAWKKKRFRFRSSGSVFVH